MVVGKHSTLGNCGNCLAPRWCCRHHRLRRPSRCRHGCCRQFLDCNDTLRGRCTGTRCAASGTNAWVTAAVLWLPQTRRGTHSACAQACTPSALQAPSRKLRCLALAKHGDDIFLPTSGNRLLETASPKQAASSRVAPRRQRSSSHPRRH